MVFKVQSGVNVYLEAGAHVRARLVQTESKVDGVSISGHGTLDNHMVVAWFGRQLDCELRHK